MKRAFKNPFPKHVKFSEPNKIVKISAVIVFVIAVAALIFFIKFNDSSENINKVENLTAEEKNEREIIGNIDDYSNPSYIDLGMIEDELSKTEANLNTIDNLEDL